MTTVMQLAAARFAAGVPVHHVTGWSGVVTPPTHGPRSKVATNLMHLPDGGEPVPASHVGRRWCMCRTCWVGGCALGGSRRTCCGWTARGRSRCRFRCRLRCRFRPCGPATRGRGESVAEPTHGLLVKDIKILATRQGMDWWLMFRDLFEPSGRVMPVPGTTTPQGDHCWVRCGDPDTGADSESEAEWLRDQMIEHGVPETAVLVKRTPKAATQ